ncbi:MAG TPA: LytTR family DNA-binding domain-containing protein, partial [Salinimicrobium sp.]|nr:LytTR family DNA-binding domain-containing protein [Salinimicrobium sp.]
DIEMPGMDGFQFLDCFQNRDFGVVITTAYDQYALSAIKKRALDYLLKPIDTDDLILAIEKIKSHKASKDLKNSLEESILALSKNNLDASKKVAIPLDGKLIFLKSEEIIYCESDGNYCHIYLEDRKKLFVTKKLKEIEQLLPKENFYRVHNSFVVNLEKVREYFKTDGYVILDNHKKIPVSRTKKSSFLDKM